MVGGLRNPRPETWPFGLQLSRRGFPLPLFRAAMLGWLWRRARPPRSFEPTEAEGRRLPREDLELGRKRREDRMLTNMKFIGHLFLRQLLAARAIGQVVHDLVGIRDGASRGAHDRVRLRAPSKTRGCSCRGWSANM